MKTILTVTQSVVLLLLYVSTCFCQPGLEDQNSIETFESLPELNQSDMEALFPQVHSPLDEDSGSTYYVEPGIYGPGWTQWPEFTSPANPPAVDPEILLGNSTSERGNSEFTPEIGIQ
mgnify:CR=1 FL=1